jgi:hypothetical protein
VVLNVFDVPHSDSHEVHNLQYFFIACSPNLSQQFSWHLVLKHLTPFAQRLLNFLSVAFSVAKPFSQVHLVKELKSIEIKLSPALTYLVDIKLIYHVFDR